MPNLIISGGNSLNGVVKPSGNKNSVLPILCASLLTNDKVKINNVPDITDMNKLVTQLIELGSKIEWNKEKEYIVIDNSTLDGAKFDGELPDGMRGSVLLYAPLIHRFKTLKIKNEIGGCELGIREIDSHIEILKNLGANVKQIDNFLVISINERFPGGTAWYDYAGVTTTENFIMGAVLAKGKSKIINAASEPHVQDLCNFLVRMGAKITGIGSNVLEIEGVNELKGTEFTVGSDHHEITTFLALGAMTHGYVTTTEVRVSDFLGIINAFSKFGVKIDVTENTLSVSGLQSLTVKKPLTQNMLPKIEAAPWPYFPADLLPLMLALAVRTRGEIMFWNKIYEGSFFWIQEMNKFGAHIVMCDPHRVICFGGKELRPATVIAPDIIRSTVALAMIALSIKGESRIIKADPINRAHPKFVEKLQQLGADIKWEE